MRQNTTYRQQSRVFLEQAFEELEKSDLNQASEKGWGAAAQMLKAIASERGWAHGNHSMLFAVMDRLEMETNSVSLRDGFSAAHYLHINFYEGWLERAGVEENLNRVQAFVDAAEELLSSG